MKTSMIRMFLALATVSLFGSALNAQSNDLVASVPFKFQVNNQSLEPGKYLIQHNSSGVVTLRSMTTGHATFATGAYDRLMGKQAGKMVFHCYNGHDCFLSEIWGFNGRGATVPPSKTEKALISEQPREVATIAVNLAE